MDRKIVLTKTAKGLMEAAGKTSLVSRDVRNVLTLIDGKATVGDLQAKLQLAEPKLNTHLATLMRIGLVREFVIAPASLSPLSQLSAQAHSLSVASLLPPPDPAQDAAKQNAEADAIAREIAAAAQAREEREERAAENNAAASNHAPVGMADSVDPFAAFRVRADLALREAEQRVHAEAEKARLEMRAKAERDAAERSKREAEDKRRAQDEAQRRQREEAVRQQAEMAKARANREAEAREQARRTEEEKQRRARDELDRRAATERALKEAQDHAQREAEERSRAAADAKAQRDAAAKADANANAVEAEAVPGSESEPEPPPPIVENKQKTEEQAARRKAREEERAKAKAQAELAAKARKEERAREIAEAEARAVARVKERQRETALVASRIQDIRRGRRSRLAPRLGLMLLLLAGLAVLMVPIVPVDATRYARSAAAKLGVPVTIGHASYALFPLPHLRLSDVQVGQIAKIGDLRATPQLGSLFADAPVFRALEIKDVQAKPAFIAALLWTRMPDGVVLPSQIKLQNLRLEEPASPLLQGEMRTDAAGRREINLHDDAGSLSARIMGQGQSARFELRTKAIRTLLPLPWPLEEVNVRGLVDAENIRIDSFDAALYDGVLKGSATLAWQNGWSMDGKLEATQVDASKFSPALDGRLRGSGQFQMRSAQWGKLAEAAKLNGNFQIEKGQINGFDLVRSLREAQFVGGKTPFSTLSGQGSADKGKLSLKNMVLDGGLFKADGNAEITPQAVNGRIATEMRTPAGPVRGTLALGGTPDALKITR